MSRLGNVRNKKEQILLFLLVGMALFMSAIYFQKLNAYTFGRQEAVELYKVHFAQLGYHRKHYSLLCVVIEAVGMFAADWQPNLSIAYTIYYGVSMFFFMDLCIRKNGRRADAVAIFICFFFLVYTNYTMTNELQLVLAVAFPMWLMRATKHVADRNKLARTIVMGAVITLVGYAVLGRLGMTICFLVLPFLGAEICTSPKCLQLNKKVCLSVKIGMLLLLAAVVIFGNFIPFLKDASFLVLGPRTMWRHLTYLGRELLSAYGLQSNFFALDMMSKWIYVARFGLLLLIIGIIIKAVVCLVKGKKSEKSLSDYFEIFVGINTCLLFVFTRFLLQEENRKYIFMLTVMGIYILCKNLNDILMKLHTVTRIDISVFFLFLILLSSDNRYWNLKTEQSFPKAELVLATVQNCKLQNGISLSDISAEVDLVAEGKYALCPAKYDFKKKQIKLTYIPKEELTFNYILFEEHEYENISMKHTLMQVMGKPDYVIKSAGMVYMVYENGIDIDSDGKITCHVSEDILESEKAVYYALEFELLCNAEYTASDNVCVLSGDGIVSCPIEGLEAGSYTLWIYGKNFVPYNFSIYYGEADDRQALPYEWIAQNDDYTEIRFSLQDKLPDMELRMWCESGGNSIYLSRYELAKEQ